jgi:hypothetical protein
MTPFANKQSAAFFKPPKVTPTEVKKVELKLTAMHGSLPHQL